MGRTPLFRRLRRALALARGANAQRVPTKDFLDRVSHQRERRGISRRHFLELGTTAGVAAGLPWQACSPSKHPQPTGGPRVAVVGGGIAGLTCAYRLAQGGLEPKVFDSWNRVGGRMYTARGMLADSQVIELGGELIDTEHEALRGLAEELGLTLDAILEPAGNGIKQDTWFFGGRAVSDDEIVEAFRPVAARMAMDVANEDDEAEFARIDELGLGAYLDSISELDPVLRTLLDVAYVGEYGLEINEQSPWNLLWLIDSETPDPFRIYGTSDEAFHVHGGNDLITSGLAERLETPVSLEHRLVKVEEKAGGAFTLSFDRGSQSAYEEEFDHVVFALPFTRLRDVEIVAEFPEEKLEMIRELGMGTNAKLMGQFSEKVWRTQHSASGSVTTDNGLQLLWDTSRGQTGDSGVLTVFAGGTIGEEIGMGTAESQMQARLAQLDQIFPGTGAKYIANSAARMHWPTVEHTRGSYTCYLPGQASYSGTEGERVGNLHFCGEHTSEDFQGYMNGGAESGERVASELLDEIGVAPRPKRKSSALRLG